MRAIWSDVPNRPTWISHCRCRQPTRVDFIFDGESGNLTQICVQFPGHKSEPQKVYDCSLVWAFTYQSWQHRFWGPVNLVQHWLFPAHNLRLWSPSHNFPIISDKITTSWSLGNLSVLVGFNKNLEMSSLVEYDWWWWLLGSASISNRKSVKISDSSLKFYFAPFYFLERIVTAVYCVNQWKKIIMQNQSDVILQSYWK